jgi:hypothetical protein
MMDVFTLYIDSSLGKAGVMDSFFSHHSFVEALIFNVTVCGDRAFRK